MKIQVLVEHGLPEQAGLRLVKSLERNRIAGVDWDFADWRLGLVGKRYSVVNLAIGYPGVADSPVYWQFRPAEIVESARAYDLLISPHDRPDEWGEYVQLSKASKPELLGVAAWLGIRNVLLMQPEDPVINNYVPHGLVVEMTRGGSERKIHRNVARLRQCLSVLAASESLPGYNPSQFDYFNSVLSIKAEEAVELRLEQFGRCLPFQPVPREAVERLGLQGYGTELVVSSWNGINSSQGEYFGGVLARTENPF